MGTFLDKSYLPCLPERAAFLSESTEKNREETHPERTQNIWFYSDVYNDMAEKSSRMSKANPIGHGKPEEELELRGYRFRWSPEATWQCERKDCQIILPPETDREDAELLLEALAPIEEKILSRGLIAKEPIKFQLGCPQWDPHRKALASAVDYLGKHVRIVWAENGCHLLGSQLQKAAKIPLKNLILHELAHLLEPLLVENLRELEQSIPKIWPEGEDALKVISPHYLLPQLKEIAHDAQQLEEAIRRNLEYVTVGGKKAKTLPHKAAWSNYVAKEVLAETIRFYYLQPCLTGTVPKEGPKGWPALDGLIHRLQREAKITIKKNGRPQELFPRKRAQRKPGLVEVIEDWLE
jgi:hypothetical protein